MSGYGCPDQHQSRDAAVTASSLTRLSRSRFVTCQKQVMRHAPWVRDSIAGSYPAKSWRHLVQLRWGIFAAAIWTSGWFEFAGGGGCVSGQSPSPAAVAILAEHWDKTRENEAKATEIFQAHGGSASQADRWVQHAFVYHLINRGRNPEALDVWLTLSWLQATVQKTDAALLSLQTLRQNWDRLPAADRSDQWAAHAGRILGFAEGPLSSKTSPDLWQDTYDQVTAQLPADMLTKLEAARQDVLTRFQTLQNDQQTATTEFLANAKVAAEAKIQVLEQDNQNLQQRRQALAPQLTQLTEQYNIQASGIRSQATGVQSQVAATQNTVLGLQTELQFIYADIVNIQILIDQTPPQERGFLWAQLNGLNFSARNLEGQLLLAQNQLGTLSQQLAGINQQLNQVTLQYQTQADQLRAEQSQIDRQTKSNTRQMQRLSEPPKSVTGEAAVLANRSDRLSTYYKLPVEQLRGRLLQRLQ